MSNMELWDKVAKTDPIHTKKVNQRGGFTAIDAHYQIMLATEQFGPIGEGWGFVTDAPIFQDKFVIIPVTLWHGSRENTFGPIYGCSEMFGNRPDSDAPKKATTDGITKALSMLGFNADVCLGKFDDNKYVAEVNAEYRQKEAPKPSQSEIDTAVGKIETCSSLEELKALYGGLYTNNKPVATHKDVVEAKNYRKSELESRSE